MKLFAKIGVQALCFVLVTFAAQAQSYRITVFGDTLTTGFEIDEQDAFPVQLQQALRDDGYGVTVKNAAVPLETTETALKHFAADIADMPDIVIIALGMMDAVRGIPLEDTERNLSRMMAVAQKSEIVVLLAGIHVPVPPAEPDYPNNLNAMYDALARKYRTLLYPNFTKNIVDYTTGEQKIYLTGDDELHPNADGVAVQVEGILPYVKEIINALDVKYQATENSEISEPKDVK